MLTRMRLAALTTILAAVVAGGAMFYQAEPNVPTADGPQTAGRLWCIHCT